MAWDDYTYYDTGDDPADTSSDSGDGQDSGDGGGDTVDYGDQGGGGGDNADYGDTGPSVVDNYSATSPQQPDATDQGDNGRVNVFDAIWGAPGTDLSSPTYRAPQPQQDYHSVFDAISPVGGIDEAPGAISTAPAPTAATTPQNQPTPAGLPDTWSDGQPMSEEDKRLLRVYKSARENGMDEEGARAMVAEAKTEGGLFGASNMDDPNGGSHGVWQLNGGGEFPNFVKWLKDNGIPGDPYQLAKDIEISTAFAAQTYQGRVIKAAQQAGVHGADLATYAQQHGQVSVDPWKAGQNYQQIFANGDKYGQALARAVPDAQSRTERAGQIPPGHYPGDGDPHDPSTPYTENAVSADSTIWKVAFDYLAPYDHPFNSAIPLHRGVDLQIDGSPTSGPHEGGRGTPYAAFQDGVVVAITHDPDGGTGIITQDPTTGLYSRYFHNDAVLVKQGDQVQAGVTKLGVLGATGTEGFPHLHFEVSKGINGDPMGQTIDPRPFMSPSAHAAPQRQAQQQVNTQPVVAASQTPPGTGTRAPGYTMERQPVDAQGRPIGPATGAPVQQPTGAQTYTIGGQPATQEQYDQALAEQQQADTKLRADLGQPTFDALRAWQNARKANNEDPNDVGAFREHLHALGAPDPWADREAAQQQADARLKAQLGEATFTQLRGWQAARQAAGQDPNDVDAFRAHLSALGARDPWAEPQGSYTIGGRPVGKDEYDRAVARDAEIERQNAAIERMNAAERERYDAAERERAALDSWNGQDFDTRGPRPETPNLDFIRAREAAGQDTGPREQSPLQREQLAASYDQGAHEASRASNLQLADFQQRSAALTAETGISRPLETVQTPTGFVTRPTAELSSAIEDRSNLLQAQQGASDVAQRQQEMDIGRRYGVDRPFETVQTPQGLVTRPTAELQARIDQERAAAPRTWAPGQPIELLTQAPPGQSILDQPAPTRPQDRISELLRPIVNLPGGRAVESIALQAGAGINPDGSYNPQHQVDPLAYPHLLVSAVNDIGDDIAANMAPGAAEATGTDPIIGIRQLAALGGVILDAKGQQAGLKGLSAIGQGLQNLPTAEELNPEGRTNAAMLAGYGVGAFIPGSVWEVAQPDLTVGMMAAGGIIRRINPTSFLVGRLTSFIEGQQGLNGFEVVENGRVRPATRADIRAAYDRAATGSEFPGANVNDQGLSLPQDAVARAREETINTARMAGDLVGSGQISEADGIRLTTAASRSYYQTAYTDALRAARNPALSQDVRDAASNTLVNARVALRDVDQRLASMGPPSLHPGTVPETRETITVGSTSRPVNAPRALAEPAMGAREPAVLDDGLPPSNPSQTIPRTNEGAIAMGPATVADTEGVRIELTPQGAAGRDQYLVTAGGNQYVLNVAPNGHVTMAPSAVRDQVVAQGPATSVPVPQTPQTRDLALQNTNSVLGYLNRFGALSDEATSAIATQFARAAQTGQMFTPYGLAQGARVDNPVLPTTRTVTGTGKWAVDTPQTWTEPVPVPNSPLQLRGRGDTNMPPQVLQGLADRPALQQLGTGVSNVEQMITRRMQGVGLLPPGERQLGLISYGGTTLGFNHSRLERNPAGIAPGLGPISLDIPQAIVSDAIAARRAGHDPWTDPRFVDRVTDTLVTLPAHEGAHDISLAHSWEEGRADDPTHPHEAATAAFGASIMDAKAALRPVVQQLWESGELRALHDQQLAVLRDYSPNEHWRAYGGRQLARPTTITGATDVRSGIEGRPGDLGGPVPAGAGRQGPGSPALLPGRGVEAAGAARTDIGPPVAAEHPLIAAARERAGRRGVERIRGHANEYVRQYGIRSAIPPTAYVGNDKPTQRAIADYYERTPSTDTDPRVISAYRQMAKEVEDQYKFLTDKGVTFVPYYEKGPAGDGADFNGYASSAAMVKDLRDNNRLYVFADYLDHPYLSPPGVPYYDSPNWKFRAVHDYFGHATLGNQFGPHGEENAWLEHTKMFSPLAAQAMATETRGQNSWVNFRPGVEDLAIVDRPFADQKNLLLPGWALTRPDAYPDEVASRIASTAEDARAADGSVSLPVQGTRMNAEYAAAVLGRDQGLPEVVVAHLTPDGNTAVGVLTIPDRTFGQVLSNTLTDQGYHVSMRDLPDRPETELFVVGRDMLPHEAMARLDQVGRALAERGMGSEPTYYLADVTTLTGDDYAQVIAKGPGPTPVPDRADLVQPADTGRIGTGTGTPGTNTSGPGAEGQRDIGAAHGFLPDQPAAIVRTADVGRPAYDVVDPRNAPLQSPEAIVPGRAGATVLDPESGHIQRREALGPPLLSDEEAIRQGWVGIPSTAAPRITSGAELYERLQATPFISQDDMMHLLGDRPQDADQVARFMLDQRQKVVEGRLEPADVAKAYFMTVSSQGQGAIDAAIIRDKTGLAIPEHFLTVNERGVRQIRPEDAAAAWLASPMGQRALSELNEGRFDAEAWGQGAAVRAAFSDDRLGSLNVLGTRDTQPGQMTMRDVPALTRQLNGIGADSEAMESAVSQLNGIGPRKVGFMKHLLGIGDTPTIDARAVNVWLTGQGDIRGLDTQEAQIARAINQHLGAGGPAGALVIARIMGGYRALQQRGFAADIPAAIYSAMLHSWLWSKVKGLSTMNAPIYHAMQQPVRAGARAAAGAIRAGDRGIPGPRINRYPPTDEEQLAQDWAELESYGIPRPTIPEQNPDALALDYNQRAFKDAGYQLVDGRPVHQAGEGNYDVQGGRPVHMEGNGGPYEIVDGRPVHMAGPGTYQVAEGRPVHIAGEGNYQVQDGRPVHMESAGGPYDFEDGRPVFKGGEVPDDEVPPDEIPEDLVGSPKNPLWHPAPEIPEDEIMLFRGAADAVTKDKIPPAGAHLQDRLIPIVIPKKGSKPEQRMMVPITHFVTSTGDAIPIRPAKTGVMGSPKNRAYIQAINAYGGRRGNPSGVWTSASGERHPFDSPQEVAFMRELDRLKAAGKIKNWSRADNYPDLSLRSIPYISTNPDKFGYRDYNPDLIVEHNDGKLEIWEAKPVQAIAKSEEYGKSGGVETGKMGWDAAKKAMGIIPYLAARGIKYRFMTEAQVRDLIPEGVNPFTRGTKEVKTFAPMPGVDWRDLPFLDGKIPSPNATSKGHDIARAIDKVSAEAVKLAERLPKDANIQALTRFTRDRILKTAEIVGREEGLTRMVNSKISAASPYPIGMTGRLSLDDLAEYHPEAADAIRAAAARGVNVKGISADTIQGPGDLYPRPRMYVEASGDPAGIRALAADLAREAGDATDVVQFHFDSRGTTEVRRIDMTIPDGFTQDAFQVLSDVLRVAGPDAPRLIPAYNRDGTLGSVHAVGPTKNVNDRTDEPKFLATLRSAAQVLQNWGIDAEISPSMRATVHDWEGEGGYENSLQRQLEQLGERPLSGAYPAPKRRGAKGGGGADSQGAGTEGVGQVPSARGRRDRRGAAQPAGGDGIAAGSEGNVPDDAELTDPEAVSTRMGLAFRPAAIDAAATGDEAAIQALRAGVATPEQIRATFPGLFDMAEQAGLTFSERAGVGLGGWRSDDTGQYYLDRSFNVVVRGDKQAARWYAASMLSTLPKEEAVMLLHTGAGADAVDHMGTLRVSNVPEGEVEGVTRILSDVMPEGWSAYPYANPDGTMDVTVIAGSKADYGGTPADLRSRLNQVSSTLARNGYTVMDGGISPAEMEFIDRDQMGDIIHAGPGTTASRTQGGVQQAPTAAYPGGAAADGGADRAPPDAGAGDTGAVDDRGPRDVAAGSEGNVPELDDLIEHPADPFYSALEATLDAKMPNRASADQVRGLLRGAVKPDELAWTTFDQFLNDHQGPITKQEALDFARQNAVKVNEVLYGIPKTGPDGLPVGWTIQREGPEQEWEGHYWVVRDENGTVHASDQSRDHAIMLGRVNSFVNRDVDTPTRYGQYTIPGGKNYRELLLTLPPIRSTNAVVAEMRANMRLTTARTAMADARAELRNVAELHGMRSPEAQAQVAIADRATREYEAAQRAHEQAVSTRAKTYHSPHWSEPNVLAHVRFNERVGADGKKTLFIEEIQSDWHQEGRKKGYQGDIKPLTELPEGYEVKSKSLAGKTYYRVEGPGVDEAGLPNAPVRHLSDTPEEAVSQALGRLNSRQRESNAEKAVPNAPFQKTWPELTIKRMVRWAAENGFDQIAWTPGKVQAARYDLGRTVARLRYNPGEQRLTATLREGGTRVINNLAPQDLAAQIGQETAQQLLATPLRNDVHLMPVPEGVNLGGGGMEAFYDRMLPNIAGKLGKQFGAKVGEGQIASSDASVKRVYDVMDQHGDPIMTVNTPRQAQEMIQQARDRRPWDLPLDRVPTTMRERAPDAAFDAHTLPITDEMRQSVLGRGQPLFDTGNVPDEADPYEAVDPEVQDAIDSYTAAQEIANPDDPPRTTEPSQVVDELAELRRGQLAARERLARAREAASAPPTLGPPQPELPAGMTHAQALLQDREDAVLEPFPSWARSTIDFHGMDAGDLPEGSPGQVRDIQTAIEQGPNDYTPEQQNALRAAIAAQYQKLMRASAQTPAGGTTAAAAMGAARALEESMRFSALMGLATLPKSKWDGLAGMWQAAPISGGNGATLGQYLASADRARLSGDPVAAAEADAAAINKAASIVQGSKPRMARQSPIARNRSVVQAGRAIRDTMTSPGITPRRAAMAISEARDLNIGFVEALLAARYNSMLFGARGIFVDWLTDGGQFLYKLATDPFVPDQGGTNLRARAAITGAEYSAVAGHMALAAQKVSNVFLEGIEDLDAESQGVPHSMSGWLSERIALAHDARDVNKERAQVARDKAARATTPEEKATQLGYARDYERAAREAARSLPMLRLKKASAIGLGEMAGRLKATADVAIKTLTFGAEKTRLAAKMATDEGKFPPGSAGWHNRVAEIVHGINIDGAKYDTLNQLALREAQRYTYQGPMGTVGRAMEKIQKNPVGQFVLPFLRALYHIRGWSVDLSPLGLAATMGDVMRAGADRGLRRTETGRRALGATRNGLGLLGGPYKDTFRSGEGASVGPGVADLDKRLMAGVLGSAAMFWMLNQAFNGNISAAGPADDPIPLLSPEPASGESRRLENTKMATGWRPYSVRLPGPGGTHYWVSYSNWGPLALMLGAAASIAEAYQYGMPKGTVRPTSDDPLNGTKLRQMAEQGDWNTTKSAARRFFGVAKDMTYLSGFTDLFGIVHDLTDLYAGGEPGEDPSNKIYRERQDKSEIGRYIGNIATSAIPVGAIVNTIAQAQDPNERSTEFGSIKQQLASHIPEEGPLPFLGPPGNYLPQALAEPITGSRTGRRQGLPVATDVLGRDRENPYGGIYSVLPFRSSREDLSNHTLQVLLDAGVGVPSAPAELVYKPEGARSPVLVLVPPAMRAEMSKAGGKLIEKGVADLEAQWTPAQRAADPDGWKDALAQSMQDAYDQVKKGELANTSVVENIIKPLSEDSSRVRPLPQKKPPARADATDATTAAPDATPGPDGPPSLAPPTEATRTTVTTTPGTRKRTTTTVTATPAPAAPRPAPAATPVPDDQKSQAEKDRETILNRMRTPVPSR